MPAAVLRPVALRQSKPLTLDENDIVGANPSEPGNYRVPCPRCEKGPRDIALSVTVDNDLSAVWWCHRCQWRGNCAGEHAAWRYGLRSTIDHQRTERALAQLGSTVEDMHPTLSPEGRGLWSASKRITRGSPSFRYLTEARGIDPDVVLDLEHAVRWLPDHPRGNWRSPALIALVTDIHDPEKHINLQQTWLNQAGTDKAPGPGKPRLLLKDHRKKGGVVRLTEDAEVTTVLSLGEGVETCLSAITLGMPCWAAIDADNLARFPVLDGIERLTIITDHDRNEVGQKAADELKERWAAAGRSVSTWLHPEVGRDLNDWLIEQRNAQ